jgi:hypothetical protein
MVVRMRGQRNGPCGVLRGFLDRSRYYEYLFQVAPHLYS